jgi:hypothetical protein
MANSNPHVGDIGTAIRVTVTDRGTAVNLSTYTTLQLIFKNPDGTVTTQTADFTTTGANGQIEYVTQSANDLDVPGAWKVQARVVSSSGRWKTAYGLFTVDANLE